MSQLTVYREPASIDEPYILSFQEHAAEIRRSRFRLIGHKTTQPAPTWRTLLAMRTKVQHHNQCCPECRRVTVEPVEMFDGSLSRNGALIQNSTTLIGFSCNACGHEWPAS